MATQYQMGEDGTRLPEGVVLAHTLYGEPATGVTLAYAAAPSGAEVMPSAFGVEWEDSPEPPVPVIEDGVIRSTPLPPDRANRCRAKDDTCRGWKINDSDFCAAHAGKLKPKGSTA